MVVDGVGVRLGIEHERLGVDLLFSRTVRSTVALLPSAAMWTGCIDRA